MPIEVIVGHPHSDIGKGWLTSSIATQMGEPLLFKIDPLLEESKTTDSWVPTKGEFELCDDGITYTSRGHKFVSGQQISMGSFIAETLQRKPFTEGIANGEDFPPLTMSDISAYLAADISQKMELAGTDTAVIEIGGSSDDPESKAVPGAIRLLSQKYDTGIVLVTKFDSNEVDGTPNIKTRTPVRSIDATMREYWAVPLHAVYVRRGNVPDSIDDDQLAQATTKIAFKTQLNPQTITYLPNLRSMEQVDTYTTKFATRRNQRLFPKSVGN